MKHRLIAVQGLMGIVVVLAIVGAVPAGEPAAGSGTVGPEQMSSLADTNQLAEARSVVRLPGLTIHGGQNKYIEMPGQVCLADGILEFLAVEPQSREYESVLTLQCKPSAMHFALLLIGCEPGPPAYRAKPGKRTGDRLHLEVQWTEDGKSRRLPAEQFLLSRRTKQPPKDLQWIFSGSYFVTDFSSNQVFQADAEQAFVSLWWSASIPINVGRDYGIPYREENEGFEVNAAKIPAVGTPITLVIRRGGK
jgi:hypothetical protein